MPLHSGYSKATIAKNIKKLKAEGKKPAEARAIALSEAERAAKKAGKPSKAPKKKASKKKKSKKG